MDDTSCTPLSRGALGTAPRPSQVKIGSLDSKDTRTLFAAESAVSYSLGHLLFWRDGNLLAQPFDAKAERLMGDPFPIAQQVIAEGLRDVAASVSQSGELIYGTRPADALTQLTWKDRSGRVLGTIAQPANYTALALAPDDRRVAVSLPAAGNREGFIPGLATDIWVIDLERSTSTRITFAPGNNSYPTWSPDGDQIAFFSSRQPSGIYHVAANGAGGDELLHEGGFARVSDWSRDGRFIAFTGGSTGSEVWILPLASNRTPFAFIKAALLQDFAAFSPDGRWLAYSTVDGAAEEQVFVQPFPATRAQYQISRNGGRQPMWRSDGKELYFLGPDGQTMAVAIDTRDQLHVENPVALFGTGTGSGFRLGRQYAVSRDGQRFLINAPLAGDTASLTVVTNWLAAIRK